MWGSEESASKKKLNLSNEYKLVKSTSIYLFASKSAEMSDGIKEKKMEFLYIIYVYLLLENIVLILTSTAHPRQYW